MKIKLSLLLAIVLITFSCKKNGGDPAPPSQPDPYFNSAAGSFWDYHSVDNSGVTSPSDYTITSTSRDSSISSKSYHVYDNSLGGSQYLNITGHDYYEFDSLPAGLGVGAIERLYLKDNAAAGTNWSQNISVTIPGSPLQVPFTITNSIMAKDITRTVGGKSYSNVIHVSTAIHSSLIPAASLMTNINSYYAPGYGLIENSSVVHLDYLGLMEDLDTQTTLVSATLK